MEEVNSGRTDIGPMIKRIEALHKYEKSREINYLHHRQVQLRQIFTRPAGAQSPQSWHQRMNYFP